MHTHKDAYQEEPLFKKIDELKFSIRHTDLLIIPIVHDREVSMAVQCQEKIGEKNKAKLYNPTDELLLKLIANAVSMKIDSIFAMEQEKIEMKQIAQWISSSNLHSKKPTHTIIHTPIAVCSIKYK